MFRIYYNTYWHELHASIAKAQTILLYMHFVFNNDSAQSTVPYNREYFHSSKAFASSSLSIQLNNDTALTSVVRLMKTSFFSFTIEWKAFFWYALKLSNLKIILQTCWYIKIAHACEGQRRSMFQLSCTWLWLVNCREVKCIANVSRR
jgi:hypothetical protein